MNYGETAASDRANCQNIQNWQSSDTDEVDALTVGNADILTRTDMLNSNYRDDEDKEFHNRAYELAHDIISRDVYTCKVYDYKW